MYFSRTLYANDLGYKISAASTDINFKICNYDKEKYDRKLDIIYPT